MAADRKGENTFKIVGDKLVSQLVRERLESRHAEKSGCRKKGEQAHQRVCLSLSLYTTEESASTRNAIVADRLYNGQSLTRNGRTNTQISD